MTPPLASPTTPKYTRKPGSTAGTRRVLDIPMTNMQYLRWLNKKRPLPPALAYGDVVQATGEGAGGSEMDDGYWGAIRSAPRVVGNEDGQVPLAVALRLAGLGLVRKMKP